MALIYLGLPLLIRVIVFRDELMALIYLSLPLLIRVIVFRDELMALIYKFYYFNL